MIVRRLGLRNFKKFRDLSVVFTPGLNVIKGPNEAGKSTLHSALRTAFFDKPTTQSAPIKRSRNWRAEDMFSIEADITVGSEEYQLRKDFAARKAALSGGDLLEPLGDPDAVQERLRRWLGCPTDKFFGSTVCVGHDQVAVWHTGEIAPQLERLVAGGDVAAREAVQKLSAALRKLQAGDLGRTADRNPGQIRQTKGRLDELLARRTSVQDEVTRLVEAKAVASQCRDRLGELAEELSTKLAVLENNAKAATLATEIAGLEKEDAAWRRAKELHRQVDALAGTLESHEPTVRCEDRLARLAEDSARLEGKRRRAEALREESAEAPAPARGFLIVPIIGAVLMVAGIAAGLTMAPGMYVTAIAGLGILIFGLMKYLARSPAALPRDGAGEDKLEAEIAADSARIDGLVADVGAQSVEDALRKLDELRDVRQQHSQAESGLRGAIGGATWEQLKEQASGLGLEIERKKDVMAALSPSLMDPVKFEQLRREVSRLEGAKSDCERKMAQAGYVIDNSDADADEPARIDDEICELKERLARLEGRVRVYEAAIAGIEEAERDTMEKATDAMQAGVGSRVEQITQGRYSEVKVDEGNLSMRVRSEEKGDWVSVDDDLSRATRDQFYLAARLSLIDQLCGEARPPLLLDDPFVTFDADRLDRTMGLLKQVAGERQILLFTCHAGYEPYADNVVDLGALAEEQGP